MKKILSVTAIVFVVGTICVYWYLDKSTLDSGSGPAYQVIEVTYPKPDDVVTSPLSVTGRARGTWFFEASFPVTLVDWDGLIIAEGYAAAQGEWMTEELVPFTAVLEFEKPTLYPERGALILRKDNPSDLPELDESIEIPVRYE